MICNRRAISLSGNPSAASREHGQLAASERQRPLLNARLIRLRRPQQAFIRFAAACRKQLIEKPASQPARRLRKIPLRHHRSPNPL